jgi:hypothetical protein
MRIIPLRDYGKVRWPIPDTPHDEVIITYRPPHVDTTGFAQRLVEGKVIIEVGWAALQMSTEEAAALAEMLCSTLSPVETGQTPEGGDT